MRPCPMISRTPWTSEDSPFGAVSFRYGIRLLPIWAANDSMRSMVPTSQLSSFNRKVASLT